MVGTRTKGMAKTEVQRHSLTLNIYEEDGNIIVDCVQFGTAGQGATLAEALSDWAEATDIYLNRLPDLDAALATTHRTSLVDGVREMEEAYSERIGQPVEPTDIRFVKTLTLPFYYASLSCVFGQTSPRHLDEALWLYTRRAER